MKSLSLVWILACKDLRLEYRSRQAFLTTLFFAFLILVLFNFAFDPGDPAARAASPGILWVSLLFPGIIQLNRSFQVEMEEGTLQGLVLAPVDSGVLFFGKFLANWLFLTVIDSVILLAFLFLFNIPFSARIVWLFGLMILAGITFTALGTLFAAMVSSIRTRDVLLPILLFPLLVPVLIASVSSTRELLSPQGLVFFYTWLRVLIGCGVIFTAASLLVFEYVIRD